MAIKKARNPRSNSSASNVGAFLDELKHPLRKEIDELRRIILQAGQGLEENIKWNGPNFTHQGEDRITMRVHPPTQLQLIFHRGAAVKEQPGTTLIEDSSGLLSWRGNDRAIATFRSGEEIAKRKTTLVRVVHAWIDATSPD